MSDDKTIDVWVNPLAFFEVDEPWASVEKEPPGLEAAMRFLCTPGINSDLNSLIGRYREISVEEHRLFAPPDEDRLLDKLVWPLRHAKASYMVGNYLGTISLCGMVAEMIAILLFEMSNILINKKPIDRETEVKLFGSRYEKLGQERRIAILRAYNIIDGDIHTKFETIRLKRNQYLHLFSKDHHKLAPDAIEVFNAAVDIVVKAIGQDIKDGRLILNPALLKYLDEGLI